MVFLVFDLTVGQRLRRLDPWLWDNPKRDGLLMGCLRILLCCSFRRVWAWCSNMDCWLIMVSRSP